MKDADKNSKSLVLITRVGSTPTTGINRQPGIERFRAAFFVASHTFVFSGKMLAQKVGAASRQRKKAAAQQNVQQLTRTGS